MWPHEAVGCNRAVEGTQVTQVSLRPAELSPYGAGLMVPPEPLRETL